MLKGLTTIKSRMPAVAMLVALILTAALAAPAAAQTTKAKVDLNTADLATIAALPGIGETVAKRIIDARPFKKLDDLAAIKGLGQAKLDGLKDLVKFSKVEAVKEKAVKTEGAVTAKETTVEKTKPVETAATKEEKELININKADLKTLQTLPGIGEALAQKIIDGRPFKTMDDLGKVKGLGETKLKDLKGLIAFEDKAKEKSVKTAAAKETKTAVETKTKTTTTAAEKTKTTETVAAKEEKALINVNKADLKTLVTLPGIGEALAQKIIDGRPYKTMDDLGKVKGIGDAKIKELTGLVGFEDKVKEKPVKTTSAETTAAKTKLAPGEKLNINTATAEQLDALFGIGPVKSQAIVDYRTANGKFAAIEDIMKVKGIKEGEFAKIKDLIKVK